MKIVLSIGYGRLHLVTSAIWLAKAGVALKLVCGWVPRRANGVLVRLCSKIVGHDLSTGMAKRSIVAPGVEVHTMTLADFWDQGSRLLGRHFSGGRFCSFLTCFNWKLFGFLSKRYLHDIDVFHCRSGAGQGGAISVAKHRGIKVLVDHSALHPAATAENLREDCARWGEPLPISPDTGVWINVMKDCEQADILMVNANHIRDAFIARGYAPEKIRVVYLGVPQTFAGVKKDYSSSDRFEVLFTGNVSILKGAEYILQAAEILKQRGVNIRFRLVGEVQIPQAMREKYAGAPVEFCGWVPQDDLRKFIAESDVYLFPSLADGCAQSGMEALAAGLPVIATYQSGLPITDGETGLVVPMKDANAIVQKIEYLMTHANERERLGENAKEMMQAYTWGNYAKNVKKIYEEMIGG